MSISTSQGLWYVLQDPYDYQDTYIAVSVDDYATCWYSTIGECLDPEITDFDGYAEENFKELLAETNYVIVAYCLDGRQLTPGELLAEFPELFI